MISKWVIKIILKCSGARGQSHQDGAGQPGEEQPGQRHSLRPEHEQLQQLPQEEEEDLEADLHRGCTLQTTGPDDAERSEPDRSRQEADILHRGDGRPPHLHRAPPPPPLQTLQRRHQGSPPSHCHW